MAIGYPSATNMYVPNHAASQSLVVGFSRSPNTFRVSDYTQYVNAKKMQGLYYVWASRQAARILTSDDAEHDWWDGEAAPTGTNNLEGGQWQQFLTRRKAYPFTMGNLTVKQADFPILAAESAVCAQQCMTARTLLVQNSLTNASWGGNTADVTTIANSGAWNAGSVGYGTGVNGPFIKTSLQYGSKIVHQQTLGVVTPSMLTLVVNPAVAQAMAASTEIQDYIKQSPFALAQLRGDVPNQNGKWDLPSMLYGHPVAVEDCVRVTSRKGAATDVLSYVLGGTIPGNGDGIAYLIARQGELEGIEGTRSYSTVQIFFYADEMTVYSKYDSDNERYLGRVVSNFVPVTVTTLAGFRFTKVLG
jgi:hypothetical protein